MSEQGAADVLGLTAKIVSAQVGHHTIAAEALPLLIQSVYASLSSLGQAEAAPERTAPTPAVPIRKSVFPDFIICLEDGKKMKMLKRYLQTSYQLSPKEYRAKWGLPADYPMVAPSYASQRSTLAKTFGLGRKPVASEPEPAETAQPEPVVTVVKARRARGSKG